MKGVSFFLKNFIIINVFFSVIIIVIIREIFILILLFVDIKKFKMIVLSFSSFKILFGIIIFNRSSIIFVINKMRVFIFVNFVIIWL